LLFQNYGKTPGSPDTRAPRPLVGTVLFES
jgi:hypothetical protein